jgi:hypothetical protein
MVPVLCFQIGVLQSVFGFKALVVCTPSLCISLHTVVPVLLLTHHHRTTHQLSNNLFMRLVLRVPIDEDRWSHENTYGS